MTLLRSSGDGSCSRGVEREQASYASKLIYLGLPFGVGGEVILETQLFLLRQSAEDVGVFEVFEAFVVHLTHLGTAASLDSK
jgi:hypothetical protein